MRSIRDLCQTVTAKRTAVPRTCSSTALLLRATSQFLGSNSGAFRQRRQWHACDLRVTFLFRGNDRLLSYLGRGSCTLVFACVLHSREVSSSLQARHGESNRIHSHRPLRRVRTRPAHRRTAHRWTPHHSSGKTFPDFVGSAGATGRDGQPSGTDQAALACRYFRRFRSRPEQSSEPPSRSTG